MNTASIADYARRLGELTASFDWTPVAEMARDFDLARKERLQVFICGNGGSAANALHWANDFLYPITKKGGDSITIHALSANPAVISCLGNDLGYESIFAYPLRSHARKGDLLVVLSGSGNSPNILQALRTAKELGMKSYAILGFDGGKAKSLADVPIHFPVQDMQLAEDAQMIVCHALTQALCTAPA